MQFRSIPESAVFLTVDIDSLYPSIPPWEALKVVEVELRKLTPDLPLPQKHLQFLLELLKIQLQFNYFVFDGHVFSQQSGLPMGRAWAPAVASIFMGHWDKLLLNSIPVAPLFYGRYLDDVLVLCESVQHAEIILAAMRSLISYIKIGDFKIDRSVNYLDIQLTVVQNNTVAYRLPFISHLGVCRLPYAPNLCHVACDLFRKSRDLIVLLDFQSEHPISVKLGTTFGQCVRITNLSTNLYNAGRNIRILLELMVRLRNLPPVFRRRIHKRVLIWLINRICSYAQHSAPNNVTPSTNYSRIPTLRLPASVCSAQFGSVLTEFNSRLSEMDKRVLSTTRITNDCGVNLLRVFSYK
jgi:hypothetical protein